MIWKGGTKMGEGLRASQTTEIRPKFRHAGNNFYRLNQVHNHYMPTTSGAERACNHNCSLLSCGCLLIEYPGNDGICPIMERIDRRHDGEDRNRQKCLNI